MLCNTNLSLQLLGDFTLSNSLLTFNSLNANNRLCAVFDPVDDTIVEDTEIFVFMVSLPNSMDSIVGRYSYFQFLVFDSDGKNLLFRQIQ